MKFPEQFRAPHPLGFESNPGDAYGCFKIPSPFAQPGSTMLVIACAAVPEDGVIWDHVSVSFRNRCPTWEEMALIKSLFWSEDECVVQFHPAKEDYVNMHKYCLHLWKYDGVMPTPPKIMVGVN